MAVIKPLVQSFFGISLDWETEASAAARFNALMAQLNTMTTNLRKIMSDTDDLVAAIPLLQAAITQAVADIEAELAAAGGSNPRIAASVQAIKDATATLTAEHAKVTPPAP